MNFIDLLFAKLDDCFAKLDDFIICFIDDFINLFYFDYYQEFQISENEIYVKHKDGYWSRSIYDENHNLVNFSDSDGYWMKIKYSNNIQEFYEDSTGFWSKITYNDGEPVYTDSKGQSFILKKEGIK